MSFVAVLIAGVLSMVVGFVWYSPGVLGKPWMKLMGYTEASLKKKQAEMGKWYAVSFVLALLTAYILSHVMTFAENFYGYARLSTGITSAIWMWLGFVMPVQMTEVIFGGKSLKLLGINTGYQLVSLLVMGVVLGLW